MADKQPFNQKPILDLSTTGKVDRCHIIVDGEPIELRAVEELSLKEQQRINYGLVFLQEYLSHEATIHTDKKAEQLFDQALANILVDADALLKKLTTHQKSRIINAYAEANKKNLPGAEQAGGPAI